MQYAIVRMFPEATRRDLAVGDMFEPDNRASAQALMQAGMLRACADPEVKRGTLQMPERANPNTIRPAARFKR